MLLALLQTGSSIGPALLAVVIVVAFGTIVYLGIRAERKRREALRALARKLGLRYAKGHDTELAKRYGFLERLRQGHSRYAQNILSGEFEGQPVRAFDYHFATTESTDKGTRTSHHYLAVFAATLPREFEEVTIAREGFFSKLAQAIGFDDIDFESHEFSRKFCVRSKDKKLAYDVCNPQMIEYLLAHDDLAVELESRTLAVVLDGRMKVAEVERNLGQVVQLRELLPDYLFEGPNVH